LSEKQVLLTHEGIKEREKELRQLKTVKRKEIAEKIKEARAKGDLSENAEYDAARDEQAHNEARIAELEKMLRAAVVIDEEELDKDVVNVGTSVTLFCKEFDEEEVYSIVGSAEAAPERGKISNESPLGASLLGRRVGDEVSVDAPMGTIKYLVRKID